MRTAEKKPDAGELRVLILEDNPADAELIERQLRRAKVGFTSRHVEGKRNFSQALVDFKPQVILSDFKLPEFDGLAALELARTRVPDTPFIFVSGSIGEEKAIETLSLGAADYIFKDNLARLGPAVKRVVDEARLKLEKKQTDEELRRHVDALRLLAEAADRFVQINDLDKLYGYLAQTARSLSGADYLAFSVYDDKLLALRPKILLGLEPFWKSVRLHFATDPLQMVFYLKDMRREEFSDFVSRRLTPGRGGLYGLLNHKLPRAAARAIEKLLAVGGTCSMGLSWENQLFGGLTFLFTQGNELKNPSQIEALGNLAAVTIKRLLAEQRLRESEQKYRLIAENIVETITVLDMRLNFTYISPSILKLRGYTVEEAMKLNLQQTLTPDSLAKIHEVLNLEMALETSGNANPERSRILELQEYRKDGSTVWVENSLSFLRDAQGKAIGFVAVGKDISERKQAEEKIQYQASLLHRVSDAIIATDQNGHVQVWNKAAEDIYGWKTEEALNKPLHQLLSPTYRFQERSEIFEKLARDGAWSGEIIHHHRDGRPLTIQSSITNLKGPGGEPAGRVSINSDITERKLEEAEFLRQRVFLEKLVETAPAGIVIADNQGQVLKVNSEFVRMFGYDSDEAPGKLIDDMVVPPQYLEEARTLNKSVGEGKKAVLESVRSRRDGSLLQVSIIIAPIYIEGEQVAVYAIYQDISERKQAEAEILREKAFLEALVETAPEGIVIHDNQGRVLRVNSEFVRMFGYDAGEVVGKVIDKLVVPPGYLEEATTITQSVGGGKKVVLETVRKRKDGTLFNVSIIGAPIYIAERQVAVYAIYRDISERKRSEKDLQDALDRHIATLKAVPDLLFEVDRSGQIFAYNAPNNRSLYVTPDKFLGKNIDEVLPPGVAQIIHEALAEAFQNGFHRGAVYRLDLPSGPAWFELSIAVKGEGGHSDSHFMVTARDISERYQAAEQLKERDLLLQNLSAQIPGMIYTFLRRTDGSYCIPYSSNAIQGIFGVSPPDVIVDAAAIFKPILADDRQKLVASIENSARTLAPWQAEFRVQLPGQPVRWMLGQADPYKLGDGSILWYGFANDITEHKHAEEHIRSSLKEKEVLLQEIHHRVKNNLQIVSGLLTLQADQSAGKSLDELFRSSQDRIRSIALVHEKLYRSHNLAEIAFDDYLHALVDNLITSQESAAGRVIAIYDMESILFTIEKAIPLGLIVNELVSNSLKHAFPAGRQGEIRIGLRRYQGAKSFALKTDSGILYVAPTCELVVADNGIGMPSGQPPFGQNTLGMNLVSMLARQIQAELQVKSGPGSEFRLVFSGLPASEDAKEKLK